MTESTKISQFIHAVRRRLNLFSLLAGACWGFVILSAGMLLIACGFVVAGHAVARIWYLLPAFCSVVFAVIWYLLRRYDVFAAASKADGFFDLHDSLLSAESFNRQGRSGGIYELQARSTAKMIENADAAKLRFIWPKWMLTLAAVMLLASVALSFLDDSPAVKSRVEQHRQTEQRSAEIAAFLKKKYDELEKKLDARQKEQLKKSTLKKQISGFEKNKDLKETLKKLASIEKEFRKLSAQAAARQDEKFLKKLGKNLSEGKNTKKLGAQLSAGDYASAAKTMKEFKSSEQKKNGKDSKAVKDAMKKLAQQMADANQQNENGDSQESQQMKGDVEKAAAKFSQTADQMESSSEDGEANDFEQADADIDEMAGEMDSLEAKLEFSEQMGEMAEQLGECQNYCMGNGKSGQEGMNAGKFGMGETKGDQPGKGIGTAAANNRRKGDGKIDPKGKATELKGIKGTGPSAVMVSDASSGSGVSVRKGDAEKTRKAFQSQVESFVRREDVPENLKGGVKKYFEIVHENNK